MAEVPLERREDFERMEPPAAAFTPASAAPGILRRVDVRTLRLDLGERWVALREFVPVDTDRRLDAIVYFHGGSASGHDAYDEDRALLATEAKARVISVDYRSDAGHAPADAGLDDCLAAVRFIHNGGGFLTLSIAGDGVGGILAIAVAQALLGEITLAAQLLLYPGGGPDAAPAVQPDPAADLEWNYSVYSAEEPQPTAPWRTAAPGSLRGLPPTVLADAGLDSVRDGGRALASRLVEADVEIVFLPNPTLARGFQRLAGSSDAAAQATRRAYWALAAAAANSR